MNKYHVRILSAFFGLAALAVTAKAQAVDHVVVNIPYEFVVEGQTLPAGNYTVNRLSNRAQKVVVISNFENHKTVYVLSSEIVESTAPKHPAFDFQLVGDQHVLEKIETAEHVFTIPVSRATRQEIARKNSSDVPGSGSSESK